MSGEERRAVIERIEPGGVSAGGRRIFRIHAVTKNGASLTVNVMARDELEAWTRGRQQLFRLGWGTV
jgi:hypothetical protein